jgi:predicted transcriptional regulator
MQLKKEDWVLYKPTQEIGRVKTVTDSKNAVTVVYQCNNDWKNFTNYTGQLTQTRHLELIEKNETT